MGLLGSRQQIRLANLVISGCVSILAVALAAGMPAMAQNVTATGDVTPTGAAHPWIVAGTVTVGFSGDGTLIIEDGGTVSDTFGVIGSGPGSTGTATVTGVGSTWTNGGDITVGNSGNGILTIEAGGAVSNTFSDIGLASGSTGMVTVTGAGSTWTNNGYLRVGRGGTGTLNIADGGTVSNDIGYIGRFGNSTGAVVVSGAGSTWTNSDSLFVGALGGGILTIEDGGLVSNTIGCIGDSSGSTGAVTVTGANSTWTNSGLLCVGNFGDGTLIIESGGAVSNTFSDIGLASGSTGMVTVTGAGSTWTNNGQFRVGRGGTGTLNIADGGTVSNTAGFVGYASGSTGTVTVDGTGSSWTNSDNLYVGVSGTGTLGISDGGAVSNTLGYIGSASGSTGTVTVDGTGSSWTNSDNLYVGVSGTGTLGISGGGAVSNTLGYIGLASGSTGAVTVDGTGSSWTNSDSLSVGVAGTGALGISDGGAVINTNGFVGSASGSIGTVTVDGTGSSWTNSGNLSVGHSGTGTLTVADDGTVDVDGTLTIAQASGSTGTLNIGGAQGDAATAAGTLDVDSIAFGAGTGRINFNHTDSDFVLSADISGGSGTAAIINQIAGTTTLTGNLSAFNGTTTVSGGALSVSSILGGIVNLDGGRLGGTGTLGTLAVQSGGTLAPGNSIGTLNVLSATLNAGAIYEVELNGGGFVAGTNNDLLNASGTVTINGGTVHVTPVNGTDDGSTYLPGTYTIITATGGVTGAGFDTLTDDYAFLDFALGYDANNVLLTSLLPVTGFCLSGSTANQCAAGDGTFSLESGNAVFDAVRVLSNSEAPGALDQLSGEIHASAQTALLEDSRFPREAAADRLRVAFAGVGADNSAQIEGRISESFAVWGQGFGSGAGWESDGNAATLNRKIGGFLLGADGDMIDNVRLGLMSGYSRSSLSVGDRSSSGTADTYMLGVYGGAERDAFTLTGGLVHSWHDIDTSRSVTFTGFSDSLSASFSARTLQAWGEAAYNFETGAARFEPFANLAYVSLSTEGFTESDGAAALTVASNIVDATFTTLGLRAETDVRLGNVDATLRGMAGWRHAFSDTPTSQMRFASGSDALTIAGVPLARDSLVLDAGIEVNLSEHATLGFAYGGHFARSAQDHSASVSLNVRF